MLTKREREVVLVLTEGLSNKQIARRLDVREGTIKMHLHTIFVKLKLSNRVELAVWARNQGYWYWFTGEIRA